jgi:hypothetical protein
MSRAITEAPTMPRSGCSIGEIVSETLILTPSLRIRSVS